MQPEDRLDALLASREDAHVMREDMSDMDGLAPLLEAVDRLEPLRQAMPRAAFAASLEARLLARAAELQATDEVTLNGHAPLNGLAAPTLRADDSPTLPSGPALPPALPPLLPSEEQTVPVEPMEPGQQAGDGAPAPLPLRLRNVWRARQPSWRVPLRAWQTVAAAVLLLVIGGSFFAAVASAAPGSLLFGLRRWGQEVSITLDASAEGRTRQHLELAWEYLGTLDTIIAQHPGDAAYTAAYTDAFGALRQEDHAATSDLASVTDEGVAGDLQRQLDDLQQHERLDLRSALPAIEWSNRVLTTQALGELDEDVPVVTSATVERETEHGVDQWRIRLTGTGFQPGAQLMLNGRRLGGAVLKLTPTVLEVAWPGNAAPQISGRLGVQNPDNTAAETSRIQAQHQSGGDDSATPSGESGDDHHRGGSGGATATPGADDHGGGSGGGSKGGSSATPTPKPSGGSSHP